MSDILEFVLSIVYVTARALYVVVHVAAFVGRALMALADLHLILEPLYWTGRLAAPALTFGTIRVNPDDAPFPATGRFGVARRDGGLLLNAAWGLAIGLAVWVLAIGVAVLVLAKPELTPPASP